jgi:hypothetical protein
VADREDCSCQARKVRSAGQRKAMRTTVCAVV